MQDKNIMIKKIKNKKINDYDFSKIIITGNQAECITHHKNNIDLADYWRNIKNNDLAKSIYIKEHGENVENIYYRIKNGGYIFKKITRNKSKNKSENMQSLYKTIKKAKRLINTNITKNTRMVTLTYHENMQNTKKLYIDTNLFMKNLKNYLFKNENIKPCDLKYSIAREPQARGAWHLHILLYFKTKIFIENKNVFKIWNSGQELTDDIIKGKKNPLRGYVNIQAIKNKNNVGAYVTSYLTNLTPEIKDSKTVKKNKKGERLHLYPSHFKMFTHSRNLKKPVEYKNIHKNNVELLEKYGFEWSKYQNKNGYMILNNDGEILKTYHYEKYTKKVV